MILVPKRLSEKELVSEASGNRGNQRHHENLNQAKAAPLQRQHNQYVQRGDKHASQQRQPK